MRFILARRRFALSFGLRPFLVAALLGATALSTSAADGVTEVNLALRGLVYDPFTQKLYGTSAETNNLLQIDPVTGAVLRAFDIGTTPSRLELSAGRGIWVGLDGEGAVRRFNLETFTAEEKIVVLDASNIRDIAPSSGDPYTLAVATDVTATGTTYLIRNGQVLPQTTPLGFVAMSGNFVYGQNGRVGPMLRVEMTANGFGAVVLGSGRPIYGDAEVFEDYFYHSSGSIFHSPNIFMFDWKVLGDMADVTFNRDRSELLYLAKTPTWILFRFDRPSHVQTGEAAFGQGNPDPGYVDLQAWGTNRAAFHSRSTLYLLDVTQLFLPADLAVSQSAGVESLPFGTNLTVTITVTNKGPGAAPQVVLTNYLEAINGEPANIRLPTEDYPPIDAASLEPVRAQFGTIAAGESRTFTMKFLPGSPGLFTNRVVASTINEANPQDNANVFTVPIASPTGGIARIPLAAADMTSDPSTGKLWALAGQRIWSLHPDGPRLSITPSGYFGATRVAASPRGDVYVGFHDAGDCCTFYISKVPSQPVYHGGGTIDDMEVSPSDSELVAVSQAAGTFLFRAKTWLPDSIRLSDSIPQSGFIAFSADGTKLYRNSLDSCDLSIYAVTPNGITLERTLPGVACAEFTSANGLLYFHNGLIFDPTTGTRVPNTPVVSTPPAFLNPTFGGAFDLFNRTNGIWTARRFRPANGTNFVQFAERSFPEITSSVIEMNPAGPDRIALRTASEILIVDLPGDPNSLEASISRGPGETTIRFASAEAIRYRVERTDQLQPAQWNTVRDNIVGTGGFIAVTLPTPNQTGFYRIVRLP